MFTSLLLLSSLAPSALAHRPHDDTPAFAVPSDFESSGRAWAILDPHDVSQLLRSDDHGLHWDFICGPTMEDLQTAGGYQGDTLVFLSDRGRVWTSNDEGETWDDTYVIDGGMNTWDMELSADWGMIASEFGVFVGDVAGDPTGLARKLDNQRATALFISPENTNRAWIGLENSVVQFSTDAGSTWQAFVGIPGGYRALDLLESDGRIYAGTNGLGALYFDDDAGAWAQCGTFPFTNVGDYVTHVPILREGDDGVIYAANGNEALFYTEDRCQTWGLLQTGENPEYGGIGNASNSEEAFTDAGMIGRHGWVTGFMGTTVTSDYGETWYQTQMVPSDYARGIAFAPDFPEDPRIFVGGYGGGAWWSWDGGETWEGSAASMNSAYSYDVQPGLDLAENGTVWFSGSLATYRSSDGGYTWDNLAEDVPINRVRAYRVYGDRTYALGENQDTTIEGQIAYSDDRGETWYEWDSLYEVLGASAPQDIQETVLLGDEILLVVADSPPQVVLSEDAGATWEQVYAGPDSSVRSSGAALWPPGEGERMFFADPASGLVQSNDGGATWFVNEASPEGVPRAFTMADDGTLFLLQRVGQIYRSEDGGDSWVAVGEPVNAASHDLVTSPRFDETGILLIGSQDGLYFSEDRGDTWKRLRRFSRLEAVAEHLACYVGGTTASAAPPSSCGCSEPVPPPHVGSTVCETYEDEDQGLRGGWLMNNGDEAHFTFTGTHFEILLGPETGGGEILVESNGAFLETIKVGGDLWVYLDAPDGDWKDITLTYSGSEQLHLDAVEIYGDGELISLVSDGDSGSGGDSGGDDGGDDTGPGGGDDSGEPPDTNGGDDTGASATDGGSGKGCCNRDASDSAALILPLLILAGVRRRRY